MDLESTESDGHPWGTSSTIASPELLDIELQLAPAIPDSQEDTMTVISQERSNSSMDVRLSQSEADLLKQKSYSVTLENRISELKRRNDDLEHCISLASSAQGNHEEETRLREVISSLKNKLDREQLLTKNYRELEADRLGFLNTSLRAEYGNMHSNIRDTSSMICHLSLDDTLPEQRTGFAYLANNWARRIGGHDLGSLLGHCESEQIPKRFILVSLLAAGIFELVLEEVFPAFLAADSPLLDQYRKHIETQKTETISDMRSTLHHALKLKIELMLSVKRLKYLFFRPGTLFDAGKMDVVKSQAGDTALLGQEVKICLLPALFTIPEAGNETGVEEESGFKANYNKALVEATDEDIESLVLVEKAIVFL
ncbi:hypothetical protein FocTR4_00002141 [Fusarium oxysporum f. sp. cubense]|uniref:Uncharacterized protein n=1 Tax=Fusarium oxysporum f. sp. cubense TaxID=61366 RepID=A0A5C6SYQ5_FUSOC|nr:hypothetical protein FocTR4_00002141 [Fusarium oxysporum f. sp. cubense]